VIAAQLHFNINEFIDVKHRTYLYSSHDQTQADVRWSAIPAKGSEQPHRYST
jgi:hypothetical protein